MEPYLPSESFINTEFLNNVTLSTSTAPINDPCFFDGDRELRDLAYQFCDEPAFYSYYSGCPSSACSFDAACALDIN